MEKFKGRVLPDAVASRLEAVCAMGQLSLEELDERAFDALKELTEQGALHVLDQFANSDLSHVQNKSAYLCGIMKTHREKKRNEQYGQNAEENEAKGPNEELIKALLERTGYSLDITMGQRKYGGPPPGWVGPPPPTGTTGCCQVFVGKIPRDMFEDELIPPFEQFGQIYDFRLMMDPHTGQNKGYGFCTFSDKEAAQAACKALDNKEIRPTRRLGVCISIANDRLFVGSIPKTKTKEEILEEFRQHTDNLKDAIVYISAEDKYKNRGFAFLEYETHKAAALARRRLMSGRVKVWGHIIPTVDWADPIEEPDTETMSKVRVIHVRNVSNNITEEEIQAKFAEFGEIERVKKLKNYAFIHYKERESAETAINQMNGQIFDNLQVEVSLAKPHQPKERRHGQSGFGALNAPGKGPMGGDRGGYGGPRGNRQGRGRGGGGYGGYSEGYDYYGYGGGDDYYSGGYGDGYGADYSGYNNGSYDYNSAGYSYEGYGNDGGYGSYGDSYGDGYGASGGGGYGGGYGGDGYGGGNRGGNRGRGGRGGPRGGRGGPRGGSGPRGGGSRGGGPRGGGQSRGGRGGAGGPQRGGRGRGGPSQAGGRGRGRGGAAGTGVGGNVTQGKRKFEVADPNANNQSNVSYPEPKKRFNQAGSQPIAQQPLEQTNQAYTGGYDQTSWYQDTTYQHWT